MPIEVISFQNETYPLFQTNGNAARFALPFAREVCKGVGVDIGCNRKEWAFPGAIPVDISFDDGFNAFNLPVFENLDYCFASHVLEHIPNWTAALEYWTRCLKPEGTLFLYLPHYDQKYWRPNANKKHCNIFTPEIIKYHLENTGYKNVFASERDLYHSFMVIAEKI